MEDEAKKYDPNNPQELTRDLYKKFRFETLVSLAQGKSVVVSKTITEGSLPFKDEPTASELPLPLRDGSPARPLDSGLNPAPQAAPQVDLNKHFSSSGPETELPISDEERLRSNNACAPPSARISS